MKKTISRRHFTSLTLAGVGALFIPSCMSARSDSPGVSRIAGVELGVQSYSYRDRSLAEAIRAIRDLGLRSCELWAGHIEPSESVWQRGQSNEEARKKSEILRRWKDSLTESDIRKVREQFNATGIRIQAYNAAIKDKTSDADIDQQFQIAQWLGTDLLTTSATVKVMKRVNTAAEKYHIRVGMHNHANIQDPNEFATPESFARGMEGNSELIGINLDIGHFTAANYDPLQFIEENHKKIFSIHLKDRKKDQGPRTRFGEGDTPVAEVLKLIRDKNWPNPANIEYEYSGDTDEEMKSIVDFCRNVLQN